MCKKVYVVSFVLLISFASFQISCEKTIGKLPAKVVTLCDTVSFIKTIQPLIQKECVSCHYASSSSGDFTSYAGIKIKVDAGSFKARLFDSPGNPMPPTGMFSKAQLDMIQCWLDKGASNE